MNALFQSSKQAESGHVFLLYGHVRHICFYLHDKKSVKTVSICKSFNIFTQCLAHSKAACIYILFCVMFYVLCFDVYCCSPNCTLTVFIER